MYNDNPLVTVAIPFKDPGNLFLDSIKSVFCQTYTNWELILINDGSSDGSAQIATKITDSRVILVNDGKHLGLVERLNQIPSIARGKYIARMDADDMMHPRRLELQVAFLENNPDYDLVDTGAVIINRKREPVGTMGLDRGEIPEIFTCFKRGVVLHASVLARKTWFEKNRYDRTYKRAEDRELFIRTLQNTKIKHINMALYYYYFIDNLCINRFLKSYSAERKVLRFYGQKYIGTWRTFYLIMRSYLKSFLILFLPIGVLHILIKRTASNQMDESIKKDYMRNYDVIRRSHMT